MKAYLGDGAYMELRDGALILTAENGIRATDTVVLGPEEWATLLSLVKGSGDAEFNPRVFPH